jgi:hypothetical protein
LAKKQVSSAPPPRPDVGFSLGVTGHREANANFAANRGAIEAVLHDVMTSIDASIALVQQTSGHEQHAPTRLHALLTDGLDQIAARQALARNWDLIVPLPFGVALNTAINANPAELADAKALVDGLDAASPETQARADLIEELISQARCFELADQDAAISALFLDKMAAPNDIAKAQAYSFAASERVALAAQVMIEQSDLIIGVWDGANTSFTGGTGHTIALALSMGAPVLWIDARAPQDWRILFAPEELAGRNATDATPQDRQAALIEIVRTAIQSQPSKSHGAKSSHLDDIAALDGEKWPQHSPRVWHAYRRVEALFGSPTLKGRFKSLRQTYESPDEIATGSAKAHLAKALALPGQSPDFVGQMATGILRRFAWADGISSRLSDTYRGGMILNFVFSAFAIVSGMAYLPFASGKEKWAFALIELILLGAILAITFVGQKRRWHGRWFETRRVAEYLRHAPILLLLGVARPAGRWPKGSETSWPEYYVRHGLRGLGLPQIAITSAYLQAALSEILLPYVSEQMHYHHGKAKRLARVHHQLDQLSELLFKFAVASVSCYLLLKLGGVINLLPSETVAHYSKLFTFLGVLFPTFGAGIAGIRYFGDFERFSAISDVTAKRLDGVATRIKLLLQAPTEDITYAHAADLAHATDDIVIAEIESWQAVFSGKHITVPV